jgi:hypothetical protein
MDEEMKIKKKKVELDEKLIELRNFSIFLQ